MVPELSGPAPSLLLVNAVVNSQYSHIGPRGVQTEVKKCLQFVVHTKRKLVEMPEYDDRRPVAGANRR